MIVCTNCHTANPDGAAFCNSCGQRFEPAAAGGGHAEGPIPAPQAVPPTVSTARKRGAGGTILKLVIGIVGFVVMLVLIGAAPTAMAVVFAIATLVTVLYLSVAPFRQVVRTLTKADPTRSGTGWAIACLVFSIVFLFVAIAANLGQEGDQKTSAEEAAALAQAEQAIGAGQFETAAGLLEKIASPKNQAKKEGLQKKATEGLAQKSYDEAVAAFKQGRYADAQAALKKVPESWSRYAEVKNTIAEIAEKVRADSYQKAVTMFAEEKLDEALALFKELGTYQQAAEYVQKITAAKLEVDYRRAIEMFNKKQFVNAESLFAGLGAYKDSLKWRNRIEEQKKSADYAEAVRLFNKKECEAAKAKFEALGDFKQSKEYVGRCKRQLLDQRATNISYGELKKNPDRYTGTFVRFRGEIFNIQESGGKTVIQVHVTPKGWGIWDDQVMVLFNGTTRAVEDNVITFYGKVIGSHSYQSVAGWNITVPAVQAETIYF